MLWKTVWKKDALENSLDKNDKPKPKGHGRNAAADYTGAEKIKVPHALLLLQVDRYMDL